MPYAFLPDAGVAWLCEVNGPEVTPLAPAPGLPGALRRFSTDGREFAFLDQEGKRLGHYKILPQAPWFESLVPPCSLPKGCTADDFVIHQGSLIAGGKGPNREALWMRHPERDLLWRPVALPEGIGQRGKSIDALFVRGDKLVAVDNVMAPKWILVYPLEPELRCTDVEIVTLRNHTTYETVRCAAEGEECYALYSFGNNHGTFYFYIALIGKSDLAEVALWSGFGEDSTAQLIHEVTWAAWERDDLNDPDDMPRQQQIDAVLKLWSSRRKAAMGNLGPMLASVQGMAFCGDQLALAVGSKGLYVADAHLQVQTGGRLGKSSRTVFTQIPLNVLSSVQGLQAAAGGLYAIGMDANSAEAWEWVPQERLQEQGL